MRLITKRFGRLLIVLGLLVTAIGVLGGTIYYSAYGERWAYTPLGLLLAFCMILIGPALSLIGIPIFIISVVHLRRMSSKLMVILKNTMHTKTVSLTQQLSIDEQDLKQIIFTLQSNGEPIYVDYATTEVTYGAALPPLPAPYDRHYTPYVGPSSQKEAKKTSQGMSAYEKLTIVISIVSILAGIIVALLR